MVKKGIILAGGNGSRVGPSTKSISKQLIPLADKPIIFYSLSILMLLNIKDILIIVKKEDLTNFKKLLGNGKDFGVSIKFIIQKNHVVFLMHLFLEKFIKNNVSSHTRYNFFTDKV